MSCSCTRNSDGTVTSLACPAHATYDPCAMFAAVTGKRRKGTIRKGICTNCGHKTILAA